MNNPFMPSFGRLPKIAINQQNALNDYLTENHVLDGMPDSNQLDLFSDL
jgi:hypothetical protein